MDNGKPIRESRDSDVPLTVRHFCSHAGWAQILPAEFPNYTSVGVIAQIVPWNFPLLMLAWKIAPALAAGNTVVLKPAPSTRLSAALFCDLAVEAGLPPGVVNVISGDNEVAERLATHPGVDKVAFTGSTPVGKHLRTLLAGTGAKLSLELGGKSPVIVYESADLDAAVEGVVAAIWFNGGQVCCAGSRLLLQESIAEEMIEKLKVRMRSLRVGDSLDKCADMSALVDETHAARVASYVDLARSEGADVYQVSKVPATTACFYPPTLVTRVESSSALVQEEIFGPVLVVQTFRTPHEAVKVANSSRYGLAAGVWTESVGLAMETALSVRAGVVWINCHNLFDAVAGFGGFKESGVGREGGKEGMYEYMKLKWKTAEKAAVPEAVKSNASGWGYRRHLAFLDGGIDRTTTMFIGGSLKKPDGNSVLSVLNSEGTTLLGTVGDGNPKDIRDAVQAATKAAVGWGKRAAYNRSHILHHVAENLRVRRKEFASSLAAMTGCSEEEGEKEVDETISRLFTYAAYADKYGGEVKETPFYGVTSSVNEPVGVIGAVCGDANPLLQFVSLVAPAIARGNAVVVVPSEKYPLAATHLYQAFDTSDDLPGGVVNIVTGQSDILARALSEHQGVDGMWYFGDQEGRYHVERLAAGNMKRTFVGRDRDWMAKEQGEGEEFLREACEVKTIWMPIGGD